MYLIKRISIISICLLCTNCILGQLAQEHTREIEIGLAFSAVEAPYNGIYSKASFSLSESKSHFYAGLGLTTYADFRGEIAPQSKLRNDVDMRIIPNVYLGYDLSLNRFNISMDVPIGTSIAITRGKLENTRVDFEREYSSTNFLWHYGLALSIKFQASDNIKVGMYAFLPAVIDDAWSPAMVGLGVTKVFNSN